MKKAFYQDIDAYVRELVMQQIFGETAEEATPEKNEPTPETDAMPPRHHKAASLTAAEAHRQSRRVSPGGSSSARKER